MRTLIAAVAITLSTAAGAGGVYRCTENGRVSYADQPCGHDAVAMPAPPHAISIAGSDDRSYVGDPTATALTPVAPGMSPKLVYQAMGRPRSMDVRIEGIAPVERWYYASDGATLAVTFRHGRVSQVTVR
jgi:hypothetical protein